MTRLFWLVILSLPLLGQNAVIRDEASATIYDKGGQVVNVKAYGATGDGVTDDTAAINLARAAAQANRMKLWFPGGTYCISSSLLFGDGTSLLTSTLPSIQVEGSGHGYYTEYDTTPRNPTPTVILWCAGAPGVTTHMVEFRGPQAGGALRNLQIDPAGVTNVFAVKAQQVSYFDITDVTVRNQRGGFAVIADSQDNVAAFGTCNNTIRNLNIQAPQSGGQGVLLTGSTSRDSCSWVVIGGDWWHDGASPDTTSLDLSGADNNLFLRTNFYSTVPAGGTALRCGVRFTQWSVDANYPQENTFISNSAHDGVCGSYGAAGNPNVFIDWHLGDCTTNCDPNAITTGVKPVIRGGAGGIRNDAGVGAILQIQPTNGTYPLYQDYWGRGYDVLGTELWSKKRGGESGNGVQYGGFAEYQWQPSGDMLYKREGTNGQWYYKNYSSTSTNRTALIFERAYGTIASPTQIGAGAVLGAIAASGRNSGGTQSFAHRINLTVDTVDGSAVATQSTMAFATVGTAGFADYWKLVGGTLQSQLPGGLLQKYTLTSGSLPTCNAGNKGIDTAVDDATAPTFLGVLVGGGGVYSAVICNGTNWVTH